MMAASSIGLLLLLPVAIFAAAAIAFRLPFSRRFPRQLTFAAVALSIASLSAGVVCVREGRGLFAPWHASLFPWALALLSAHFSFHVFNMSETARRIRILLSLRAERKAPAESGYTPEQMVRLRLSRLEELGQASLVEGRWWAKGGPLLLAALLLGNVETLLFPERRK